MRRVVTTHLHRAIYALHLDRDIPDSRYVFDWYFLKKGNILFKLSHAQGKKCLVIDHWSLKSDNDSISLWLMKVKKNCVTVEEINFR